MNTHFAILACTLAPLLIGTTAPANPAPLPPQAASTAAKTAAPNTFDKLHAQIEATSKRALADPAFIAMLDRADADGAKKLLVRYGAPPTTKFAVARRPTFVFSPGDGSVDEKLPMRCTGYHTVHVPDDDGGWDYAICRGYEINRD